MPVVIHQLLPANSQQPGYEIAVLLSVATIEQFAAVRHTNAGIGPASCCAGFAVQPAAQFPALRNQNFGMTFGNSRVAAGRLDQGPVGGHAERCAITAAGNNNLTPFNTAVLFVELHPCNGCAVWLGGGGGGVANPYDFGPNGTTLHVWYSYPYDDDGTRALAASNAR